LKRKASLFQGAWSRKPEANVIWKRDVDAPIFYYDFIPVKFDFQAECAWMLGLGRAL